MLTLPTRKNALDRIVVLSRTNNLPIRGATLIHEKTCSLKDTNISRTTNVCPYVAEYSVPVAHLTTPSAVHLIICVSPDSQQRGLSVEA